MSKQLILIRGAQGSGKSTTAAIWANHPKARWYEADQFFTDMNGRYDFKGDWLHDAHEWCERSAISAMDDPDVERVVVSNCFAKRKQMSVYVDEAEKRGIKVRILLKFEKYPNEHEVPEDVVQYTRESMEPVVGEYICASGSADMDRLVETYPKYKGVYVSTPRGEGFDGLPVVLPQPKEFAKDVNLAVRYGELSWNK